MQSLNRNNSFSFSFIAILVVITAGLLLAVSIPSIKSWQINQIDKLVADANKQNNSSQKQAKFRQAAIFGINDPVAIENLANSYWKVGEYSKVIATYQASWTSINDLYLGTTALKSDQPLLAKLFFSNADKAGESAESQAGLASVAYTENRVDEGCNHADKAKKLNLSSSSANQASQICLVLKNLSPLTERERTYLLLNSYIFDIGLSRLETIPSKTVGDWLLLTRVYSGRGELKKAESTVRNGLIQNPSSQPLLSMVIQILDANGKNGESATYQQRLKDLQFEMFQN